METFSMSLAICSPVIGEFPVQRPPVTRSFDVFFGLRLNKRLSKQWWGWWFETLSSPLWCHCIDNCTNARLTPRIHPIFYLSRSPQWHERHSIANYRHIGLTPCSSWLQRQHQSFTLLSLGEGNPPMTGGVPPQRIINAKAIPWCDVIMYY